MLKEILNQISDAGIYLFVTEGELRAKGIKHSLSPALKEKIKANKQQLINYLNNEKNSFYKNNGSKTIDKVLSLLSYAQQRLWFIDQLEEDSVHYNLPGYFYLKGKMDLSAFNRAVRSLLDRHEVLRTHYIVAGGEPRQVVVDNYKLSIKQYDLSELGESEQKKQIQRLVQEDVATPFRLNEGIMLRVHLLKLSIDDYVVLYTMHHIASDGWSIPIFQNELNILYTAYRNGRDNPLPALKVQYTDYVRWQRNWLQGEVLEEQINYWKEQLAGIAPTHSLPLDRPRPDRQTFKAKYHHQQIEKSTVETIGVLCEQHSVTLFMFLETAFALLLRHYSNETDIVIGLPIAGRTHRDVEPLIGCFVNSLAIRTNLSNNPAFSELLKANKQTILDAHAHQHLPFEILVDEICTERGLNYNPVFQIIFSVQNDERTALGLGDLIVSHSEGGIFETTTTVDLELHVYQDREQLSLYWIYNMDLFEEQTVLQMLNNYGILLSSIIESLTGEFEYQKGIDELTLLSEAEKHTLLYDWNATQCDYPRDECISQLFEQQAEKNSSKIALTSFGQQMTYFELNKRANQVANYLHSQGVKPDTLVGLCVERSLEMVIGMLGILKAGGAYMSIDPNYPLQRIRLMLNDSRVQIVLSQLHLADRLSLSDRQFQYLDIDNNRQWRSRVFSSQLSDNIPNENIGLCSSHLACVIYTSGSTGVPKGVLTTQKNIVSLIADKDAFKLLPQDVVAQASNHCFDATTYEVWGALLNGSRLVEIPKNALLLPKTLKKNLLDENVTTLFVTTALFNHIASEKPEVFSSLKRLIFGGEPHNLGAIARVVSKCSSTNIIEVYGPTECTTFSTFQLFDKRMFVDNPGASIGKPVSNTAIYILNTHLALVPIGGVGELYIAGTGVTRGYLNALKLSREKFIDNPYSDDTNECMYRTGDLARRLANGNIEFIGRNDAQVKVRGFRIEPGEIEALLAQQACVRSCVVISREDTPDDKRLVAYVVVNAVKPSADQDYASILHDCLQHSLPSYMLPSAYVVLAELPLTANGKVDRKALPLPAQGAYMREKYYAPKTNIEKKLVDIWAELLSIDSEKISVIANFFALGGHSLLATRLVNLILQEFDMEFPIRTIFENPTVEDTAKYIQKKVDSKKLKEVERQIESIGEGIEEGVF